MTTEVTVASLENVPEIIALCYKSFSEIGKNLPKPDTIKAIGSMSEFVNNGLVFVKKTENDTIIGVLALVPFDFWWSEETVLHTATFYVVPEYRKDKVAKELVEAAQEYAKVNDAILYLDVFTEDDLEAKDVFLRRQKFDKSGYIYRYKAVGNTHE